MALPNDIVLRPRFQLELEHSCEILNKRFKDLNQERFIVTVVDDHIFIKIPQERRHFWSPQLHLELLEMGEGKSKLFGLFGPNPTIWTMFMFFHFIVAAVFIGFGIWAYSLWSLEQDYTIQTFVSILMVLVWFILYFIGRLGRRAGKPEMRELYSFMSEILGN